ncbi:Rix1 complex component [Halteromyces radiatus]|uniref:Rix1 complex component n=1 Tax=Halteromyces radiatus TaxID=101107 RepID=UPI00221E827E|nr:Rix1 complex component [Halteromyces radiatus]KAI8097470.1 Rix1 complex component [Halteromyces radiatus]
MPNARKKKAAKNEDFKKKKLKVGKTKALPDNYTDTSFTSKSISLPNQSITEDKSKEITTGRNLTMTDLVTQLKHYNSSVKKDALAGLQELFRRHPTMLISSLSTIVNSIVKLFIDDDREVRKALMKFLNETFTQVDKVELEPFVPLLIIYTCSAMTHIMEDIRLDAIKLLDLWVGMVPEAVIGKFWKRISGNFISLLAVGSNNINISKSTSSNTPTTTSSVKAAAASSHLHVNKSKLELLTSLSKFFEAGLFEDRQDPYWFMYNFLDDRHARKTFKRKFNQDEKAKNPVIPWDPSSMATYTPNHVMTSSVIPYLSNGSVSVSFNSLGLFEAAGSNVGQEKSHSQDNDKNQQSSNDVSFQDRMSQVKEFIETFQPILIGNWLESAPMVFTISNTITYSPALQMLHTVLHVSLILWRAMVSGGSIDKTTPQWLDTHLQQLLKHISVYFPYGLSSLGNGGAKVDSLLQEMNIMTCELTSLFLLARKMQNDQVAFNDGQDKKRSYDDMEQDDMVPTWANSIVDYVLGLLGFDALDTKTSNGAMTSMSSEFRNENLVALLPAVWGFLNCLEGDRRYDVFRSFINYSQHCNAHSASKKTTMAFIIRAYLIQSMPSYTGRFILKAGTPYANLMQTWLLSLPKLLCNLSTKHIDTSQMLLNVMCDIAKRGDKDIFDSKTLERTALSMSIFFYVHLPNKGDVYGPFLYLPVELQKRALEFMYFINATSERVQTSISKCKSHDLMTKEVLNWIL